MSDIELSEDVFAVGATGEVVVGDVGVLVGEVVSLQLASARVERTISPKIIGVFIKGKVKKDKK
jgi:hypothetical protein